MANLKELNLSFPALKYSERGIAFDLKWFLYRNGAETKMIDVDESIARGDLGEPILDRIEILQKVHEHLAARLSGGGSKESLISNLYAFRDFVRFVDRGESLLNLESAQNLYMNWTDSFLQRVRILKDLKERSAYDIAAKVGKIIDAVLERSRPIIVQTRLRSTIARVPATNKQNLETAVVFGHLLQDVCSALTAATVFGPLPIRISLRSGQCLLRWCRLSGTQDSTTKEVWDAHSQDTSLISRSRVVNLRIEAELLMFIAQTGMNWSQAVNVDAEDFSYTSYSDGYKVCKRKNRRNGDVEFEIYKGYRAHFEAYLAWRKEILDADDIRLFPFIAPLSVERSKKSVRQIRQICDDLGMDYFGPQLLRTTRTNFFLRESNDPEIASLMGQHSPKTLWRSYAKPNHQIAMVEIHRFHQQNEPNCAPAGPGACVAISPEATTGIPISAPRPDCANPAGCLFCKMQRDVDSLDYIWSLLSFRHLKTLELATIRRPPNELDLAAQPSYQVVNRITMKIDFIGGSSPLRRAWISESLERLAEDDFHPMWRGFIQLKEQSP